MTRDWGYPMAQYNRLKKSTKTTGNLLLELLPRKNLIFLFNMAREFPVQTAHFIVLELGHRTNDRTNIKFCSQKLSWSTREIWIRIISDKQVDYLPLRFGSIPVLLAETGRIVKRPASSLRFSISALLFKEPVLMASDSDNLA